MGDSLPWVHYERQNRVVNAAKMPEDFLLETMHGWIQGKRGDWIVEVDDIVRFAIHDSWFIRIYALCKHGTERV